MTMALRQDLPQCSTVAMRLSIRDLRLDIDPNGDDPVQLRLDQLDLQAGETCILFGNSGIGKTTLLEVLAGLRPPAGADQISLSDLSGQRWDLSGLYRDQKQDELVRLRAGPVGYVPQGGAILPFLSARHNALLGAQGSTQSDARLLELAVSLGMCGHLDKDRAALSGGQRKRVALMRGLIQPRALLLLDEPTAGLDNDMADRALELIVARTRSEGSASIIVMHDIERALRLGVQPLHLRRTDDARVILDRGGL